MNFQKKISFFILPLFILFLSGCADKLAKKSKSFKHDTPLIKTDVKKLGKKELNTSAKMGPVPVDGDVIKLKKRKQLSSVKERNYLLISEEFTSLKSSAWNLNETFCFKEVNSSEINR